MPIPESQNHFSELLILLGIAGLTIPLLQRFRISPVLGFLLCGILVGPYGLSLWLQNFGTGWGAPLGIRDSEIVSSFADMGIVFLMFMIGLKLSLSELWSMRRHILGLGSCQIVLTGTVVFLVARLFNNSMEMSILLGACFALSSTAVVMQLLEEKKKEKTPVGRLCFSILLMQDLAVVPILTMIPAFAMVSEENLFFIVLKALLVSALSITAIYFIGLKILEPILRYLKPEDHPEWLMSFVLFLVIGMAMLTESFGLSAALGAFMAGLLLAETEYRDDVEVIISPVKGLLLGVFFLSVGMMIDVRALLDNPVWIFLSVIGIGVLKASLLFLLCRFFRLEKALSAETAIMLGQGGEFVFVIVAIALTHGIIYQPDAQFFMLITVVSMMITPFVAPLAPRIARYIAHY
ncbi:MAG: cation:proton antiporter domain-containing protein [Micavibrio sp.]